MTSGVVVNSAAAQWVWVCAGPELLGERTAGAPLWVSAAMTPRRTKKVRSSRDGKAEAKLRLARGAFPEQQPQHSRLRGWRRSAGRVHKMLEPRVGRKACQGRGVLSKGALGYWSVGDQAFRGSIGGLKEIRQNKTTDPGRRCPESRPRQQVLRVFSPSECQPPG